MTFKNLFYEIKHIWYTILKHRIKNRNQKSYWQFRSNTGIYELDTYLESAKKERYYEIWERLLKHIDVKDKQIYDYGCNNGMWSREYEKRGAIVIGVDYIIPKKYFGKHFIQKDISQFIAEKKAFLIHTARTLHHLDQDQQDETIKAIKKNIQDGGYILVIESIKSGMPLTLGRNWRWTLEFYGFKIIAQSSDGVTQGILAQKVD